MCTLARRALVRDGVRVFGVFACVVLVARAAAAQGTTVPSTALLSAKTKVTQAQAELAQAKQEALQGQNELVKAQLAAVKADLALAQAKDSLKDAEQDLPKRQSFRDYLKAVPKPAAPAGHPDLWNELVKSTEEEVTRAQKKLDDGKTAVASATEKKAAADAAVHKSEGVNEQLQKDQQKAENKSQQAIQELLNQVQTSPPAVKPTAVAAAPNAAILATALSPMYVGPWGTPLGVSQPWPVWQSSCMPIASALQPVPLGCDPVPRVSVCPWVPGVLGATLVSANGPQSAPEGAPSYLEGSPPQHANGSSSPASPRWISSAERDLVHEDAFSSLPSISVIRSSYERATDRDEGQTAGAGTASALGSAYRSDYRFDLPARFALARFGSDRCQGSCEDEGAIIHEGMRILTREDGQYEVRFNVTAPATQITLRLQLLLYDETSAPFPKTLTLPPIRLAPADGGDWESRDRPSDPYHGDPVLLSYLVRLKGHSHVVRERNGSFLLARRIGTARFGSGAPAQLQ
jgi:hypothetical protein